MKYLILIVSCALLAACATRQDVVQNFCADEGYQQGTLEYEACMEENYPRIRNASDASEIRECQYLGYEEASDEFKQCRLKIRQLAVERERNWRLYGGYGFGRFGGSRIGAGYWF